MSLGKQTMLDHYLKKKTGQLLIPNKKEEKKETPVLTWGDKRKQCRTQSKADGRLIHQNKQYRTQQKQSQVRVNSTSYKLEKPPGLLAPQFGININKQPPISQSKHQETKINNDSSSDTVQLQIEPPIAPQLLRKDSKQTKQTNVKCAQYILIGPFDTILSDKIEASLQTLMTECTKDTVMEFIKGRLAALDLPTNLQNLGQLRDDNFWCMHLQNIIGLLLQQQHRINGRINLLPYVGLTDGVSFTRFQIFMLVSSMFLCLIPAQTHTNLTSLVELMAIRPHDKTTRIAVRFQKLKCIINYMKYMSEHEELYNEKVSFERATNYDQEYLVDDQVQLIPVEVRTGKIQEGYGQGALIDFANANVGGGFLTNGCAQQEILFSIFPELSIIKLICPQIHEEEAIVVRGARRFNSYEGYSYDFKFKSDYQGSQNSHNSVIVAVDAVDYTKGLLTKTSQFSKVFVRKELRKFFSGVSQALTQVGPYPKPERIFTGRWGCGVFGADEYLKFCIQWIICSFMKIPMIFYTIDHNTQKELQLMSRRLSSKQIGDLLSLIDHYCLSKCYSQGGLLKYIKTYA